MHPPTYEAVAKFQHPVTVKALKHFQQGVRERLTYLTKTTGEEFAVFYVMEGERTNCVHFHFLIRTPTSYPRMSLKKIVTKASEGVALLQHCEAIESVAGITRYILKDTRPV